MTHRAEDEITQREPRQVLNTWPQSHGVDAYREGMPRKYRSDDLKLLIGRRLRAARLALGLQQKDLLKPLRVGKSTWSMWENGDRLPDPLAMARFGNTHGVSLDWIYRGDTSGLPAELRRLVLFYFSQDDATNASG
jgi:ribosome-binding protein aMBF1 (putative translation factor)